GDLLKTVGAKNFDSVETPDRHISELTLAVPNDIHVISNRARIQNRQHVERRLRIENHRLANILQREPDLLSIRGCRDIGTEWALLFDAANDLVRIRRHDHRFGAEART